MPRASRVSDATRGDHELRLLWVALLGAAALMLVSSGCAWVSSTVSAAAIGAKPRYTDPYDASPVPVFRYQFGHNAPGQQKNAGIYCLAVAVAGQEDGDPADELMPAFATSEPPVRTRPHRQSSGDVVLDGQTSGRGLVFYVRHIERVSKTQAVFLGGHYGGAPSGSGNSYHMVKRGDEWVVEGEQMHGIP